MELPNFNPNGRTVSYTDVREAGLSRTKSLLIATGLWRWVPGIRKRPRPHWWKDANLRTRAGWLLGNLLGAVLHRGLTRLGRKSLRGRPLR